jgi:thiol-disulfide isomerase/thioredoxin
LSSLKGKVVLIDFWASWCGPCRKENPNVVRIYNKYHNEGFEIFGVSLDRNRDSWLKAIKNDNLSWIHVSDLKYWQSEGARLYGVNSIPFTVLLDKDGKILAKGLRGKSLEDKLEEIFN